MRQWPESWKQSLRHLAAAGFYLPVTLLELAAQSMGLDDKAAEYRRRAKDAGAAEA